MKCWLMQIQIFSISRLAFLRFTFNWYCPVAIKNIKNMHAVLTNQIADFLHFNDKAFKKLRKN